ncbi:MAG: MarR family winged helix-turn-helix transcriptional regulator [Holosporales bacterium]
MQAVTHLLEEPQTGSRLGFTLWQVHLRWRRAVDRALQAQDLTYVQYLLMHATLELSQNNQAATQCRIAAAAGCDVNVASQVIRGLVARQLMTRKDSPQDARAKIPRLTSFGEVRLRRAHGVVEAEETKFFQAFGNNAPQLLRDLEELLTSAEY